MNTINIINLVTVSFIPGGGGDLVKSCVSTCYPEPSKLTRNGYILRDLLSQYNPQKNPNYGVTFSGFSSHL